MSLETSNEELRNRIEKIKEKCAEIIQLQTLTVRLIMRIEEGDYIQDERMVVHNTLAIPPYGFQRRYAKVGCTIRSNPEFHEKEAYSDIVIRAEREGELERDSYGRIFMIFSCTVKNRWSRETTIENLCFIRYYEEIDFDNSINMQILKWKNGIEGVGVIRMEQIIRAAHVVEKRGGPYFYLNNHIF
jgi:hypothetical protein